MNTDTTSGNDSNHQTDNLLLRWVSNLEQRSREATTILEINGLLSSVKSEDEAYSIAIRGIDHLFPGWCGFLGQLQEAEQKIEIRATWGGYQPLRTDFQASECLAFSTDEPHQGMIPDPGGTCSHLVGNFPTHQYLCVPISAQQQTLGLFHMQLTPALAGRAHLTSPALTESRVELVKTLTKQLGQILLDIRTVNGDSPGKGQETKTLESDRASMVDRLGRELHTAILNNTSISLLMVSVDAALDSGCVDQPADREKVLELIDEKLLINLRKEDIAGRINPNQYMVILRHTSAEQAMQVANRLSSVISTIQLKPSVESLQAPAIGVVVYSNKGKILENPLAIGEEALQNALLKGDGSIQLTLC